MKIHGWGRYPKIMSQEFAPDNRAGIEAILQQQTHLIARGAGRSYGDSSLANKHLSSRRLDHFIHFDKVSGLLTCEAGVTIEAILNITVAQGWILPVLPGTQYITIGGAIASDIHGKNHHMDGCFSQHVHSLKIMLASGDTNTCSPNENRELFRASCGGMGLTGIIIEASLQLIKISSPYIQQQSISTNNLEETFDVLEKHMNSKYSVAWLDCIAKGERLGRSVVFIGEHLQTQDNLKPQHSLFNKLSLSIPFSTPALLLNKTTMGVFNKLYYARATKQAGLHRSHYQSYFFPLDSIQHWNRLYGAAGFLQYQFVLPSSNALIGMSEILEKITTAGKGSFLSVLKKFGASNANYLSFPIEGYTLTLDFKYEANLLAFLEELDQIVLNYGGRLYLAKDARMSEATFKRSYPNWQEFMEIKQTLDPNNLFSSRQSERLGL
ncbi:MAG: FAD-linked oxidase [SAR86 cluster bacterium]|uniref:FAD-linked oxidase n=1 Tax=SAR86 cluster bacterium TaxID=2030880 RepID=A0A2A4MSY3_9GAMM|nr:MAG: FAD-linked oxidase [SAR86 cluster bacterium]